MSQAKVDEYKNYKKNKKKILKKQQRKKVATELVFKLIGWAIVIGIVVLICFQGMKMYSNYVASRPNYSTNTFILGDLNGINESETETETETEAEKETTEAETKQEETTESETKAEETTENSTETE